MEFIIKRRHHLRQPFLVGYGQLCLFFIQTTGFFDQQYIWKESDFLHGDFHQGNVASKTSTFGWVRLGVSDIQYSPKNSSILESPKLFLCFYFDT